MINLICPALDYGGNYGKSRISNLHVFAEKIANTTVAIAKEMPTFHGYGYAESENEKGTTGKTLTEYVTDVLRERLAAVELNPSIKTSHPWFLSSVWYNVRPTLLRESYEPKGEGEGKWIGTRKAVTSMVDDICQDEFGKTREELGIYASPWAMAYYEGQTYPVSFDAISQIAKMGTVIILIEKIGIVEVLSPFARGRAIALVNTKGRTSKYVRKMVKIAKETGTRVCVLTDCDAVGIQIWGDIIKLTKIPRIGIDRMKTILYFRNHGFPHLTEEELEEPYDPKVSTEGLEDGEYLKKHRIELDSILTKVGAQALWEYVEHQVMETFPEGRDCNRVMHNPKPTHYNGNSYPYAINVVLHYLEELYGTITADTWAAIEKDLDNDSINDDPVDDII